MGTGASAASVSMVGVLGRQARQVPTNGAKLMNVQALEGKTQAELLAIIAGMQSASQRKLTLKVSGKGAVSLYGLGRFPVTLYRGQWERLIGEVEHIKAFLTANAALLSEKP